MDRGEDQYDNLSETFRHLSLVESSHLCDFRRARVHISVRPRRAAERKPKLFQILGWMAKSCKVVRERSADSREVVFLSEQESLR